MTDDFFKGDAFKDMGDHVLHDPGNDRVIAELFVFMSIDSEGNNGILSSILPGLGSTPLVTGSPRTAELMKTIAAQVARDSGKKVSLYKFKREGAEIWESGEFWRASGS